MGLLDRIRGGDDAAGDLPHPTQDVRELVRNGYSQDEITDVLRDEGYTYDQINRALNAVVRESTVETGREQPAADADAPPAPPVEGGRQAQYPDEQGYEQPPAPDREPAAQPPAAEQAPPERQPQQGQSPAQPADEQYLPRGSDFREEPGERTPAGTGGDDYDELEYERGPRDIGGGSEQEELIEIIVAEQVADIEDDLDLLFDQMNVLQDRLDAIEQGLEGHSESEGNAVQELFNRIDRLEDDLSQVQSRADGMEHALQQVLPNLVENIRDLKRLIRDRNR